MILASLLSKLFAADVYSQGELLPERAHVGGDVKVERGAEVHVAVADDVGAKVGAAVGGGLVIW